MSGLDFLGFVLGGILLVSALVIVLFIVFIIWAASQSVDNKKG